MTRVTAPLRGNPAGVNGNGPRFVFDYTGRRQRDRHQPAAEGQARRWPSRRSSHGRGRAVPRRVTARGRSRAISAITFSTRRRRRRPGVPDEPNASRCACRASALYAPWTGGNIDEGWTRWVLEQYEFHVHDRSTTPTSAPAGCASKFDAIILADQAPREIVDGNLTRVRSGRNTAAASATSASTACSGSSPTAARSSRWAPRPTWRSIACRFRSAI